MKTQWGDREARRRDILAAGRSLLSERGLSALQMREVAKRADIALGTVYAYFPTKEALFSAMYSERLGEFLGEIRELMARNDEIEDVLVSVVTIYRDVYREFGSDLDVLSVASRDGAEAPSVNAELLESAGAIWMAVRSVVERAGARDPDLSLSVLWSTMTGLADQFSGVRRELHGYSFDATVRYAVQLLVSGLRLELDGG